MIQAGCAPDRPLSLHLHEDVHRPPATVIVFLVDGLDQVRMEEMLAAGELPNIRRYFVEGGVQVRDAVTSLPSITYANIPTVITGAYPVHHGIAGNFWFERRTLKTRNYMTFGTYRDVNEHIQVPTMYEVLDDHFSLNIQNHTRHGVSANIENHLMFGLAWLFRRYIEADAYVGYKFESAARIANHARRWPSIIMTYYPGVDATAHRYGSDSARYGRALMNIDTVVGRVMSAALEARPAEAIYAVLVTDHGHTPIGPDRHFDMVDWLRRNRGMSIADDPLTRGEFHRRLRTLEPYDAIGGLAPDRVFRLHLRGARGWAFHPDPAEVQEWMMAYPPVTDPPAVLFAVTKAGEDRVRVYSRRGAALIERRRTEPQWQYRLVNEEGDPLEYRRCPELAAFVDAGWQSSRDWLIATRDAEYPDFVPQAAAMFDTGILGDVVFFAADDWSFDLKQRGGHGSCMRRDMRIPLYFFGPDLPPGGEIGPGRLVDVMPTIIGLLNEEHRLEDLCFLDGINLAPQLREARPIEN